MDSDTITIVRHEDGSIRLADGTHPPAVVSFTPGLVDMIRRGESSWATVIVEDGQATETIVMTLSDRTLVYRLTGEVDLSDGLVAVLIPEVTR